MSEEASVVPSIPLAWLDCVRFNADGLVTAITQDATTGEVLMLAWMNRESLTRTVALGQAVYWSRSRARLWHKGEESGHFQHVRELRLDCDGDAILLKVEQIGGIACHTMRRRCFFRLYRDGQWETTEAPLKASLRDAGVFSDSEVRANE
jgi:phosphoribosyl-AMP cyclohydrolase